MPPNAKIDMFKAGVFDGDGYSGAQPFHERDSAPAAGFGTCCLNIDGVKYIFSGAPSHQMTPWAGRNALEAVIHLFNNIDAVRSSIRPEARIQGVITEGGAAPNVVPDRAVADFYVRYPDEVYLAQVKEFVDNAAKAAALATGTKLKIDDYGQDRDGISVASLVRSRVRVYEEIRRDQDRGSTGQTAGLRRNRQRFERDAGRRVQRRDLEFPNHTYEMEADALTDVGHHGSYVDAQAMAALLFDFLTRPDYRGKVKREFDGIKKLFNEYKKSLSKVYVNPNVPDPK